MNKRVVVTGIGILSSLGEGTAPFWDSLEKGRSGLGTYEHLALKARPTCWGGEIKGFDPQKYIVVKQKKFLKVMSRDIQLALVACKFAVEDSGFQGQYPGSRVGLSLGTSLINNELDEIGASFKASSQNGRLNASQYGADGMGALTPLWMLKYLPNMPACHISITYDLQGPSNTITTEGASALQAIGEGYNIIRRGSADCMVVGGVDSKINPIGISKYDLLGCFPKEFGATPQEAFQPFSDKVSGFLPGEAAAMLILEERESALKRKAKIYGEILGFGTAPIYDLLPQNSEDIEGRLLSLEKALSHAGTRPEDLDFLIANGSGITESDRCEKEAIRQLLAGKNEKLPVTFLKHLMGYAACASGAVEMIAALLAIEKRRVPAVRGWQGEADGVNFIREDFVPKNGKSLKALINATSCVGQAASLVIGEDKNGRD